MNAVNDPCAGWISNRLAEGESKAERHLSAFRYGGPLLALSWVVHMYPLDVSAWTPGAKGVHYFVSLCLYDTLYTYVTLEHCALLVDLSIDPVARARVSSASTVATFVAGMCRSPKGGGGGGIIIFTILIIIIIVRV